MKTERDNLLRHVGTTGCSEEDMGISRREVYAILEKYDRDNPDTFDSEFGTDTQSRVETLNYGATTVKAFDDVISSLPIRPSDFTFLDIGSGKGRALILAARAKFDKIIGVELDNNLCRVSRKNISVISQKIVGAERIDVVNDDAIQFVEKGFLPDKNIFIWMYNPFVFERQSPYALFFDHLKEKAIQTQAQILLCFINPEGSFEELLSYFGFIKIGENMNYSFPESVLYSWKMFRFDSKDR